MGTKRIKKQELRIFLSSTFRDFQWERNGLFNQVFPGVRQIARQRGVELTVIDLRWGLTDEQAQLGCAVQECLGEVENCLPYFIGLLGERYGWVPDADAWSDDPEAPLISQQIQDWIVSGRSVTDMEIEHGVISRLGDGTLLAHFYLRHSSLSERLGQESGAPELYHDPDHADQQQALRKKVVDLNDQSGVCVQVYTEKEEFLDKVRQDLLGLLDAEFPLDQSRRSLAEIERRQHQVFAADRLAYFVGDSSFLETARTALINQRRLLVVGEGGSGKSTTLAWLAGDFKARFPGAVVIEHYTGAAPGSTVILLMSRLVSEVHEGLNQPLQLPTVESQLAQLLFDGLRVLSERKIPTLIVLDALDQIEGFSTSMLWLQRELPTGIHIVVSSRTGDVARLLRQTAWLTIKVPFLTARQIEAIIVGDAQRRGGFLARLRKSLTGKQLKRIVEHVPAANPLYLLVLLSELSVFGGLNDRRRTQDEFIDDVLADHLACADVTGIYQMLIQRLEDSFSWEVVRPALGLIAASRTGINENDLNQISGIPQYQVALLRQALDFHLTNRDGRLGFAHQAMHQAVVARHPLDEARRMLCAYFAAIPSLDASNQKNHHKLQEYPWQLLAMGEFEALLEFLTTPREHNAMTDKYVIQDGVLVVSSYLGDLVHYWKALRSHDIDVREKMTQVLTGLQSNGTAIDKMIAEKIAFDFSQILFALGEEPFPMPKVDTMADNDKLYRLFGVAAHHLLYTRERIKVLVKEKRPIPESLAEQLLTEVKEIKAEMDFLQAFVMSLEPDVARIDQMFGDTIVSTIDWHSVAQAKFILEDIAGSESVYRTVLIPRFELDPVGFMHLPEVLCEYACILLATGDKAGAIVAARRAVHLGDDSHSGGTQKIYDLAILSPLLKSLPHDKAAFDLIVEVAECMANRIPHIQGAINLLRIVLLATEVVKEGVVGEGEIFRLGEVGSRATMVCLTHFKEQDKLEAIQGIAKMMLPFYKACFGMDSSKYKTIVDIMNLN